MISPTILVTGATGKTGAAVVEQLLLKQHRVRAIVHDDGPRSAALRKRGVETLVADMYDADQMLAAIQGTQRAYYVPLMQPYMIQAAVAFAVAAREAKLESIVQMSQWTSHRAHPAVMTQQTWLVDRLFADLPGIVHTIVNPGMFADNFLRTIDFAALLGIYPVISGSGKAAGVANEDIARVVAAILVDPARHEGRRYRPTGPKLLSAEEMAAIIANVVGHGVRPISLPFWMLGKIARQQGLDPFQISILRYYMEDMKRGTFAFEGGVTDVVQELTGLPAESFETTARRYAALPFAKQSVSNRLKAFVNFTLTPFYRGYNFDRWDRQKGFPRPRNPTLSIEDAQWRRDHMQQNTLDAISKNSTRGVTMGNEPCQA